MNYKNLLKEQLLSEIILPKREFNPNLLSPTMKLKMGGRKGPDGNIISALKNLKFQPSKGEQERIGRPSYRPLRYGDRGPNPFGRPSYDPTDIENSLESQRQQQRERRSRILRGRIRREFNQSDLGTQPQKPYKKKIGISLGFNKQNPDRTIY